MDAQALSHEVHAQEGNLAFLAPGLPLSHGDEGQDGG